VAAAPALLHGGPVPGDLVVRPGVVVPEHELSWQFSRSSGPGGQAVNTSDTRVQLSLDVARSAALGTVLRERALAALAGRLADGVVTVTASEHRSQWRNRQAAEERLRDLLREATAPPAAPRRVRRPSRAVRARRLADKRHRSQTKALRRRPGADPG
jgi:ribosome-associated protein